MIFNKLVRDNVPDIIEADGGSCEYVILDDMGYRMYLAQKLNEEVREYIRSRSIEEAKEELVDILEVVFAISKAHGISLKELDEYRKGKAKKKGKFNNKIFLLSAEEEGEIKRGTQECS